MHEQEHLRLLRCSLTFFEHPCAYCFAQRMVSYKLRFKVVPAAVAVSMGLHNWREKTGRELTHSKDKSRWCPSLRCQLAGREGGRSPEINRRRAAANALPTDKLCLMAEGEMAQLRYIGVQKLPMSDGASCKIQGLFLPFCQ